MRPLRLREHSHRLRPWVAVAALWVVLGAVLAPPAAAQMGPDRVERELNRTDALIERAAEVVRRAIGDRPRVLLETARELQREARAAFGNDQMQFAGAKTRLAREAAGRAKDLATAELRILDQVRQLIAGNNDLGARARDVVQGSHDREATRLLEAGLAQLRRGQRAFHDGNFRVAVRLSLFGRDLLHRAIRVAEGERGVDEARVREELSRTDDFIGGADVSGSRRHDEARRLQSRARDALAQRDLEQARRLTLRARELVLDALRQESDEPSADDARAHIERVDARYRRIAETSSGPVGKERRLLREARDHLDEAVRALDADDARRALAEAQLANSLLDQLESKR